ncbi:dynein regulatory complex protein 10 [Electrophorus electricus]|uniref:dynein regulatory complex protein 10 n=1 Tax=Electrophorus electricus TaxID=8005 RepID=UPI0015CFAFC8|nr:dynein regulatory complex protein 10 [Electrophorus electricus]XP_035382977.1 dynein regulatory complex protein 10 [Electrophorus electricus]
MASETNIFPSGDEPQRAALAPVSSKKLPRETLEPSRRKLVSLESQRIVGVLDECISKMEFVAVLPCVLDQAESLLLGIGADVTCPLMEHLRQVEAYHTLVLQEDLSQDARAKLATAQTAVQTSLANLLRVLRTHPSAEAGLKALEPITEEQKAVEGLVRGLQELRAVLLERLLTTPGEERERRQRIQELCLRHCANLELVATLEKEVAMAIKSRDEEISERDEVIRKLKSSLHLMEKTSEDYVRRTQRHAEREHQSDGKTSEGKQDRLQEEANKLRVQLNNILMEHREKEMALRKKNQKVETEIENWTQKYDVDMKKKQLEVEELTRVYEEEVEELRQVELHYAVVKVEFTQIMETRQRAREHREEEERDTAMKIQAATIIQAFWRGWLVRRVKRSKGRKSKKGKKSKKK